MIFAVLMPSCFNIQTEETLVKVRKQAFDPLDILVY
jgi:hypothetical protein